MTLLLDHSGYSLKIKDAQYKYIKGEMINEREWYCNGRVRKNVSYKKNGLIHLVRNYNSKGMLTYCTLFDAYGEPINCKTNKYR